MGKERDNEEMKKMIEFKKSISKTYGIEKLVLFGSAARTGFKKFNDIDIIVVTRKKQKQLELLPKLYHEWHFNQDIGFPVDFIAFDLKTFERLKNRPSIVKIALDEGIEI